MIEIITEVTGISREEILGNIQTKEIVEARQLYWYMLRWLRVSYEAIAILCNRTHGTVIFGVRRIQGFLDIGDRQITRFWNEIQEKAKTHKNVKTIEFFTIKDIQKL